MAIVDAGGGPATIKVTGATTPQATAAFTPPTGVLLVALCGAGFGSATAPSIAVTDSSGGAAWSQLAKSDTSTSGKGTAVMAWKYFSTSPGSITVSCAYTNFGTGGSKYIDMVQLTGVDPRSITGVTATAAFNTSTSSGATDFSTSITPGTVGSCVLGVSNISWLNIAPSFGVHDATTTTMDSYNNTTDGCSHVSFKYTSNNVAAPGTALTLGPTTGTAHGAGSTVLVEFLPFNGRTIIMQAVNRAASW